MSLSKLRKPRRRDPMSEIECWQGVWRCGSDYFAETEPLGLGLDRVYDAEEIREASREPWKRLGRLYMAKVFTAEQGRPVPWAWTAFGPPD